MIEGITADGFKGDIAIDDTYMYDFPCPPTATCDFEVDTCGWTQDTTDDLNWFRNNNRTSSANTGPSVDHSTQTDLGKQSCYLSVQF